MAEKTWININGTNKEVVPWININGIWKKCIPWININGIWKKCYEDVATQTMIVYIPASGDSISRSQSRTVSIPGLKSVVSSSVNTGTVSHNVSGSNVTIYVNNGAVVRTDDKVVVTDYRETAPGGFPDSLPESVFYDEGGYVGYLHPVGSAYVDRGTPAGSKYCQAIECSNYVLVNGSIIEGSLPEEVYYSDTEGYSGYLPWTSYVDEDLVDEIVECYTTGGSGEFYICMNYGKTLSKPDTRVWRIDYSATFYGPITNYYAYVVTLKYTTN